MTSGDVNYDSLPYCFRQRLLLKLELSGWLVSWPLIPHCWGYR